MERKDLKNCKITDHGYGIFLLYLHTCIKQIFLITKDRVVISILVILKIKSIDIKSKANTK